MDKTGSLVDGISCQATTGSVLKVSDSRAPRSVDTLGRLVERLGVVPSVAGLTMGAIVFAAVESYSGVLAMDV
jgi:hypothetical protein